MGKISVLIVHPELNGDEQRWEVAEVSYSDDKGRFGYEGAIKKRFGISSSQGPFIGNGCRFVLYYRSIRKDEHSGEKINRVGQALLGTTSCDCGYHDDSCYIVGPLGAVMLVGDDYCVPDWEMFGEMVKLETPACGGHRLARRPVFWAAIAAVAALGFAALLNTMRNPE